MEHAAPDPAAFLHIRVIIGMVTGLSVARLLNGLARFVQHPKRERIYSLHMGWSLFLLLSVIHFWWFEFALARIGRWTFEEYLFVISYAALFFFISAILYPDKMEEYGGFESYFTARRTWIYGLLAALFTADMIDTAMKGMDYFSALGPQYVVRQVVLIGLSILAIWIADRRFHLAFVVFALVAQIWWIGSEFTVLRS